jgi:hypothetical protein
VWKGVNILPHGHHTNINAKRTQGILCDKKSLNTQLGDVFAGVNNVIYAYILVGKGTMYFK